MTYAVNVATLGSSGGTSISTWTTGTRPSLPLTGQIGYNTTTSSPEYYNGSSWQSITTTGKSIAMSIVFGGS
jgi:hypothetical protein